MGMWDKFDKKYDLKGIQKDIAEAEENGGQGQREEVPDGTYEVKVEKLEFGESKAGKPMTITWFRIINGALKNSIIFKYSSISEGWMIGREIKFLKSMKTGVEPIEFVSFNQFSDMLDEMAEACDGKLEFALEIKTNSKGYKEYEIEDVFEV